MTGTDSTAGAAGGRPGFPWPVAEHRLANGLRVVVSPDRPAPVAAVNLWYRVGSRHDPAELPGLAHLFEHLMFEGSEQVGRGEHTALLHAAGADGVNASTTLDRTEYHQTVPAGALDLALWLEADRMAGLRWSGDVLRNQVAVVRREHHQQHLGTPYGRWQEFALASVYPGGHPYGHPPIGSVERLAEVDQGTLAAFHGRHYAPDNAVLTVVGAVRPDEVFAKAERYFGGVPAGPASPPEPPARPPEPLPGPVLRRETEERADTDRVYLVHRVPPAPGPDHDALTVLAALLGRGRGALLHRRLVVERPLARAEERAAFAWGLTHGSSLFTVGLTALRGTGGDRLAAAVEPVLDEIAAGRIDPSDLERARAVLHAAWLRSLTPFGSRADELARHAALHGRADGIGDRPARLAAVTAADLARVARTHLGRENRFALVFTGTTKENRG
ncbi:M16 family metallopeptidase [Kitasatospora sp. NPDC056184]|uniref:M16 family metallopeptidase n=1 Tax=Kitasatospora sp. NPDC056184 TaxID=3345738 RepID=UPI0035DE6225